MTLTPRVQIVTSTKIMYSIGRLLATDTGAEQILKMQ
jgi:hypothetical protein